MDWTAEDLNWVLVCVCVLTTHSCVQLIKVYSEDSHSRSVWVSSGATAREVCHMLVQTAHCSDQENWALLEVHPTLGLGKNTRLTCICTRKPTRRASQPGIRVVRREVSGGPRGGAGGSGILVPEE